MSPLCPHTLAEKLLEGICGSSNLSLNPTHIMSCHKVDCALVAAAAHRTSCSHLMHSEEQR